jgi:hypothetical protein
MRFIVKNAQSKHAVVVVALREKTATVALADVITLLDKQKARKDCSNRAIFLFKTKLL